MEIKHITLEDGRKAEKKVYEKDGQTVTELHVEPVKHLFLSERVSEKSKPVVYERTIEKLDMEGNIVEQKVESLEGKSTLQVVDHIGVVENQFSAAAASKGISRDEAVDMIVSSIKALKSEEQFAAQSVPSSKVKNFEAQGVIDDFKAKIEEKMPADKTWIWVGIIAAQIGGFVWLFVR